MFGRQKTTCGVVGLGIIGSRVARRLRAAKVHVYTWNRTPKGEPNFLSSPAEMVERTETIQIFVTTGEALESVIEPMLPKLGRNHILLNHSTIGHDEVVRLGALVEKTGAAFLDAPFTGSRVAAENGELVYYVGGDPKVLHKIEPLLDISGSRILPFGGIGSATVLKLATNMISATTVQVLSEAIAVCEAGGVPLEDFGRALEANACSSVLTGMKVPSIGEGDFSTHFSTRNMAKDARYALAIASRAGFELPALSAAAGALEEAIKAGHGDEDYSALARRYREYEDGEEEAGEPADELFPEVAGSSEEQPGDEKAS